MSTWASGDTLDSTTLNLRGASATTTVGYSTNTVLADSGNTVSAGTYASQASWFFGNFLSAVTGSASGTTASITTQGAFYVSILSLTTNGAEIGIRSGNTVYRFASVGVG